jgi:hypothetical protein
MDVIAKREQYLVVFVNKINAFDAIEDGGDASIFATIEWAGTMKKTKSIKRPNLNEAVYFHLPMDESIRND